MLKKNKNDGGRSKSKRPKQKNDCAVRTYAIITGKDYDECYEKFKEMGRESHKGTDDDILHVLYPGTYIKVGGKLCVKDFLDYFKEDCTYIVMLINHVFPIINGVMHDTEHNLRNNSNKDIYGIWLVGKNTS